MAETFQQKIVVLGTGGTIAGQSASSHDNVGYTSGQIGVDRLLDALPQSSRPKLQLVSEQIAQLDSKDMSFAIWVALAQRCWFWRDDPTVAGIVVTHGTDTMEETAFFLQTVLGQSGSGKAAVVLTGAMRPASALSPDGPQNLLDSLAVACDARARGVLVVMAAVVHAAGDVHKLHPYRLDAFSSGEAGPVAMVEEGRLRLIRDLPSGTHPGLADARPTVPPANEDDNWRRRLRPDVIWPRVEIVLSHAGANGDVVDAMLAHAMAGNPLRGIVVAGTGNGSLHQDLEAALLRAQATGVLVRRSSRCSGSPMVANSAAALPDSGGLSPVKARIALMLEILKSCVFSPVQIEGVAQPVSAMTGP